VRLDVAHSGAGDPAEAVQRADLVEHVVAEVVERVFDPTAAEPGQVAVAHLRPDRDAPHRRPRADPAHGPRIARVESTCDVGRRHQVEQRLVVAETPRAEALAEVSVEVHGR
jgi:hypothetical protein